MDCCHSGTNSRFAPIGRGHGHRPRAPSLPAARRRMARAGASPLPQPDGAGQPRRQRREESLAGIIHVAACQDNQFAYESGRRTATSPGSRPPPSSGACRRGETNEAFVARIASAVRPGQSADAGADEAAGGAHQHPAAVGRGGSAAGRRRLDVSGRASLPAATARWSITSPRRCDWPAAGPDMMPAYELGSDILSPEIAAPYRRKLGDQVHRSLRDLHPGSGAAAYDGAIVVARVPWEPLEPGPIGQLFAVHDHNETRNETYAPVDLDSAEVLNNQGLSPSTADPRFAQQMTYAVAMSVVRSLLAGARPQSRVRGRPERHPAHHPPARRRGGQRLVRRRDADRSTSATSTPPPTPAADCSRARWCSPRSRTTSSSTRRPTPCSTACGRSSSSRRTTTSPRSTRASPISSRC